MPKEIERKFLVTGTGWKKLDLLKKQEITQGYLCSANDVTVRVRTTEDEAWLTVKMDSDGIERNEFEYAIPHDHGKSMLKKATSIVKKVRHYVRDARNQLWEVDVFRGKNRGLIMAEIELPSARTSVDVPSWLGREVSLDPQYRNTYIAEHKVATK